MPNYESNIDYLESWSEELTARANRVRQLIGDKHWLTDGHHKEVIVREFLIRYLPASLVIGSGFIKSRDGVTCSPEIDILISDSSKHPAYFNEGGIQILPPSSAVAYIEMKSTFSADSFSKAIAAISNTQICLSDIETDIWRCICFASVDRDLDSFTSTVCQELKKLISELGFNCSSEIIKRLPTCISSFKSHVVFVREDEANNSIVLNFFNFGKLSVSIAFTDLVEHVRAHLGHSGNGELSEIVMELPRNGYSKQVININE